MAHFLSQELIPHPGRMVIKHPTFKKPVLKEDGTPETTAILDNAGKILYEEPIMEPEDTFTLPDGSRVQGILHIVGRNSKQYMDAIKTIMKKGIPSSQSLDRLADDKTTMLASYIVGWDDTGLFNLQYSPDEAYNLISNPEMFWLREQIDQFIMDDTNFFLKTSHS
jgi:hypothetical protein